MKLGNVCRLSLIWLVISSVIWSGCTSNSYIAHDQLPVAHQVVAKNSKPAEYTLGYGDVVEVKFFNHPEFNELVSVRPDGRVSLQRMGDLYVLGMTPMQLDSLITSQYSRILVNPDVTVFVREFGGQQIYVLGEVRTPGGIPFARDMTLLQAIAAAGGAQIGAKLNSVILLRKNGEGKLYAAKFDLAKVIRGKNTGENIVLQAQDIVYVPKTFVSSTSAFLKQVYDGLLPPVESYLRVIFWTR